MVTIARKSQKWSDFCTAGRLPTLSDYAVGNVMPQKSLAFSSCSLNSIP